MLNFRWCVVLCAALIFASFSVNSAKAKDDVNIRVIDSGWVKRSDIGQGVFIRIIPSPWPKDGLRGETIRNLIDNVCPYYARHAVPDIAAAGNLGPEDINYLFIQVVKSKAAFGMYAGQAFRIKDGRCLGKI